MRERGGGGEGGRRERGGWREGGGEGERERESHIFSIYLHAHVQHQIQYTIISYTQASLRLPLTKKCLKCQQCGHSRHTVDFQGKDAWH